MGSELIIALGVIAVVVAVILFARSKTPKLPPAPPPQALPAEGPASRHPRSSRPRPRTAAPSAASPTSRWTSPAAAPWSSAIPVPISPPPPPRFREPESKRPSAEDLASLKKGLASTRGGFIARLSRAVRRQARDRPSADRADRRGADHCRHRLQDHAADPGSPARAPLSQGTHRRRARVGLAARRGSLDPRFEYRATGAQGPSRRAARDRASMAWARPRPSASSPVVSRAQGAKIMLVGSRHLPCGCGASARGLGKARRLSGREGQGERRSLIGRVRCAQARRDRGRRSW